jgi:Family of unknown function (DUF5329)
MPRVILTLIGLFVAATSAHAPYSLVRLHLSSPVRRFLLFAVLSVLSLALTSLSARDAQQQARIDFLLHAVETSAGIKFIRNGTEYDGPAAAAHLRTKLRAAGARIATAEDFIKDCASESSMTHQKYKVKLTDGTMLDAAVYFQTQLQKFDEKR